MATIRAIYLSVYCRLEI